MRVGIVKPATSARRNKSKDRNKLYEAQLVALSTRFWFAKFCFVSRMTEKSFVMPTLHNAVSEPN